jgi:hypothetical protein
VSFYGNITNTARTTFSFDKFYANRYEMDLRAGLDKIMIGRYVLVEYDNSTNRDYFLSLFKSYVPEEKSTEEEEEDKDTEQEDEEEEEKELKIGFYTSKNAEIDTRVKLGNIISGITVTKNLIIIIPPSQNSVDEILENDEFWLCTGEDEEGYAAFEFISKSDKDYLLNYGIDTAFYGNGRGYDSTVWQKVFSNGSERYVKVAELNTITPIFDLAADAPTTVPLTPHLDTDSTNVYYKLHWQPSWGFRVKGSSKDTKGPILNTDGSNYGSYTSLTTDTKDYPSDESVFWRANEFDSKTNVASKNIFLFDKVANTGQWVKEDTLTDDDILIPQPAAIYYNKDGFDSEKISYSDDKVYSGWGEKGKAGPVADTISIQPSGNSGHTYSNHDGTTNISVEPDTQELSVILPSLGNTIAQIWDVVYGGRDTNETISKTNKRNLDISWENAKGVLDRKGLRMVGHDEAQSAYNTSEVNTIAGCINSVHDLMGMIITPIESTDYFEENMSILSEDRIYFNQEESTYLRKHLTYDFEELTDYTYKKVDVSEEDFDSFLYYDSKGNPIKQYTEGATYYIKVLNKNETYGSEDLPDFDGTKYYYQDYTGSPYATTPEMMDYLQDSTYHSDRDYYTIGEVTEHEVEEGYEPNKYYYLLDDAYVLDTNDDPYIDSVTGERVVRHYYTIDQKKIVDVNSTKLRIYVPGKYYYKDETGTYQVDNSSSLVPNRVYYALKPGQVTVNGEIFTKEESYEVITFADASDYLPGFYYVKSGDTYLLIGGDYNPNLTYYEKKETLVPMPANQYEMDPTPLTLINYHDNTFYSPVFDTNQTTILQYQLVSRPDIDPTGSATYFAWGYMIKNNTPFFYYDYEDDTGLTEEQKLTIPVKTDFETWALEAQQSFYEPHFYHYLATVEEDGKAYKNYILDHYTTKKRDGYYTISGLEKIDQVYYEPYKYYQAIYDSSGNISDYELATSDLRPEGTLYSRDFVYVIEDTSNNFKSGAYWNSNITAIPNTVTLGTRKEKYEMVVLPEFARYLNTIHGLLLKINQVLNTGDTLTRDTRTVQGALNTLNDIFVKFDKLEANKILMTDSFGRINSAGLNRVKLEGYSRSATGDILETDSLLAAISKLESRILELDPANLEALQNRVTALESEVATLKTALEGLVNFETSEITEGGN